MYNIPFNLRLTSFWGKNVCCLTLAFVDISIWLTYFTGVTFVLYETIRHYRLIIRYSIDFLHIVIVIVKVSMHSFKLQRPFSFILSYFYKPTTFG